MTNKELINNSIEWELYLSRPFNLFSTSVWNEWYSGEKIKKIFGINLNEGLYIENPKGVINHYRKKGIIKKLTHLIGEIVIKDPEKCRELLKKGLELNNKAKEMFKEKKIPELKKILDFYIELALLAGILPYYAGNFMETNKIDPELKNMIINLRRESYYPKTNNELLIPATINKLKEKGIFEKNAINVVTLNEVLNNKKIDLKNRLNDFRKNKKFVYQNCKGNEIVLWVEDPKEIINKIEKKEPISKNLIKGKTSYPGKVVGNVKLILGNKLNNLEFKEGDILVAMSTNPELLPIMKKSGAIVTDEGGITSHAAIISRELKIPCIIGTKIATKVLKDRDLVEVNANKGIVKILEKG